MFFQVFLFILGLIAIFDYLKRRRSNELLAASGIPKPKYTLPIFGDILRYVGLDITDGLSLYNYFREEYGKLFYLWALYTPMILVQDVKYFELILSSQKLITKSFFYDMLSSWLGNGLLLSTGSKWHKRRKILTPAFHFKVLEQFVEIFDQQARIMIKRLEDKADGQQVVDIFPIVCLEALDIIAESAMGVKINAQSGSNNMAYTDVLKSVIRIASNRSMRPMQYTELGFMIFDPKNYIKFHKNIKILHEFTRRIINERRKTLLKSIQDGTHESIDTLDSSLGLKKRMTFLDVLLQSTIDGKPLSNDDIQEEVDTFTFEGHDTTTSGLSFALYLLSRHPEVQQKVYEEICKVYGNDMERPVRMSDLQEMKYLECVIKESLRLYPPVPLISRVATEETKMGDITIPVNTTVTLSIITIGHDPEYFPNPEEFRPERFFAENYNMVNAYAFVPFSAGPRNCIGQKFALLEMKSTISCVLKHFELLPLGAEVKPIVSFVLRSMTGVNLGLKKRARQQN